ncbi:hypothetical protein L195_g042801 [Trifolium pratense]|uniref:Uncharacterized protein n=1 Tax=Trifolium pratense TaxID=57577 RepID=A0A2K3M7I0_TRIPR|nr:hypothetical protein L195_g042801 [Trifolium pratense]
MLVPSSSSHHLCGNDALPYIHNERRSISLKFHSLIARTKRIKNNSSKIRLIRDDSGGTVRFAHDINDGELAGKRDKEPIELLIEPCAINSFDIDQHNTLFILAVVVQKECVFGFRSSSGGATSISAIASTNSDLLFSQTFLFNFGNQSNP